MRSYRKFCLTVGAAIVLLTAINAWVWFGYTRHLLTRADGRVVGDLARMGYRPDCIDPRLNTVDLSKRHLEAGDWRGERVDLVTLGDSFSNGGGGGRNRFYQDYIASQQGLTVLNLQPLPGTANFIETVAVLANSGYLQELGVRHVLIEMVERTCSGRLSRPVDFSLSRPLEEIRRFYASAPAGVGADLTLPDIGFFNTGNFKYLLYRLGYLFSDHAFGSQVYRVKLDRRLFSGACGDTLLFLDKDIEMRRYNNAAAIGRVNDNFNRLARLLASQGIAVSFMPAVNKYSLYRQYLDDRSYPEAPFFETLRALPREYRLIDTQAILAERLAAGEQDLFFVDDSHWSWKASQAIFAKELFP